MSMPAGAKLAVKNWREFRAELDKADGVRKKSAETAVKVEMYRLKGALAKDLRGGGAGGTTFAPLRVVSRGTSATRKPLARLAQAVRYEVKREQGKATFSVGFTGPQTSKSWMGIASTVQDGASFNPDMRLFGSTLKRLWIRIGSDYRKGRGKSVAKYYFLRKTTTSLRLPPRPIIDPFWKANQSTAQRNIMSNFERKMKGERI